MGNETILKLTREALEAANEIGSRSQAVIQNARVIQRHVQPLLAAKDAEIERLKAENEKLRAAQDALLSEKENIIATLEHLGLEPWPDGRSIKENKIPWGQFVSMVISSQYAALRGEKGG